jgi:hypothetical protein
VCFAVYHTVSEEYLTAGLLHLSAKETVLPHISGLTNYMVCDITQLLDQILMKFGMPLEATSNSNSSTMMPLPKILSDG